MTHHLSRRGLVGSAAAIALLPAAALADASFGPKVGTRAPEVGSLPDQNGDKHTLDDLAGPKGVVLMFYRSAKWCPFCQAQLIAMNGVAAEIEKRGYKLVGISYEPPQVNKTFIDRRGLTYTLLSDRGSKVINRWKLRDPQYPPGNMAYGVPRPIIFVIGRDNVIKAALAEETFQKRPAPALVLQTLDGLS